MSLAAIVFVVAFSVGFGLATFLKWVGGPLENDEIFDAIELIDDWTTEIKARRKLRNELWMYLENPGAPISKELSEILNKIKPNEK